MRRKLVLLAAMLVLVRIATVLAYRDTLYYYGLVAHQFAIAEAAYKGHWLAWDAVLAGDVRREANDTGRHIPLEEWASFEGSGRYSTYPAVDLPGLGYLIALSSRWFDERLTTRYAMGVQVSVELASLLLFVICVSLAFGERVAWLTGLVYVFGYPFIWPIASHPMRDVFALGVYVSFIAAAFAFIKGRGVGSYALASLLLIAGSLLAWVRPHAYYFCIVLLPLVALTPGRTRRERAGFAAMVILIPWVLFGYPLRRFNLRHYGVPDTGAIGRTLWEHMGIVEDNPYGFVLADEAMLPWIKSHYGVEVEYGSPEMNRLLGDYAWDVIRRDPGFYLETVALHCLAMAKTPLDLVPPFRLVEYGTSGLSLAEYARSYPGSFAYKVFNRVVLMTFFYGGLLLTFRAMSRRKSQRLELAVLMSPLAYAIVVQALTHFESRYMATAAWVLAVPIACGLDELLARRAGRPGAVAGPGADGPPGRGRVSMGVDSAQGSRPA